MLAMVMKKAGHPLLATDVEKPSPGVDEVLIKVSACGICRTDLHILDGELNNPKLPLIPGHQVIGVIEARGSRVTSFKVGQSVGVPWLGNSCGHCAFCLSGRENLCDEARFTGYHLDGGFAEYCVANHRFCFAIPKGYSDIQAAPLFCAGLIGYRALLKAKGAQYLGLYGFGAAAHILIQTACKQGRKVYAFTTPGDLKAQEFAFKLGATWAGDSNKPPPHLLDAGIIFAPVGELVPLALKNTSKGGIVICAGIHMSNIPSFPYELIWGERTITSIANLTRKDGEEFLALAPHIPIQTEVHTYPLQAVNQALDDLRHGRFNGSAVITLV